MKKIILIVCCLLFSSLLITPLAFADGDVTSPVIEGIEIVPNEPSAGEKITVSAKVSDNQSEISKVTGFIGTPNNQGFEVSFTYSEKDDKWTGEYVLRPFEIGKFFIQIKAEDTNGNYTFKEQEFVATNLNPDIESPLINHIEVTTNATNSDIIVKADVSDSYSGVYSVKSLVSTPEGRTIYLVMLTYNEKEGKWIGSRTINLDRFGNINDYVLPGDWGIEVIAQDHAGNEEILKTSKTIEGNLFETIVYLDSAYDLFGPSTSFTTYADQVATKLLKNSESMNDLEALSVYQLLIDSHYTSNQIKTSAQNKKDSLENREIVIKDATSTSISPTILELLNEEKHITLSKSNININIPVKELKTISLNKTVQIDINDVSINYSDALSAVLDFNIFVDSEKYSNRFSEPFIVTFIVDPSKVRDWDNIELRYINDSGQAVSYKDQIISKNKETGEVVAEIHHFSTYGIYEIPTNNNNSEEPPLGSETDDKGEIPSAEGPTSSTNEGNSGSDNTIENTESNVTNTSDSMNDTGKKLPNTSTSTYNIMLLGGLLILLGIGIFILKCKKIAVRH